MKEISLYKEKNYIHLLSGGLDSAYSLLKVAKKMKRGTESHTIYPVFFDYGHYSAETERKRLIKIVEYIRKFLKDESVIADPVEISLNSELFKWCRTDSFCGNDGIEKEAEIENRNMVLFSILASYLFACAKHQSISKSKFIISSGFREKELPDCNEAFFVKISELLNMYKTEYEFAFEILKISSRQSIINKTKKLLKGSERELNRFMRLTISCYSPIDDEPCGICSKCKAIRDEKIMRSFNKR
jgi:7-cyano-7-deazaguanine synthase in queuosine biosynthesis